MSYAPLSAQGLLDAQKIQLVYELSKEYMMTLYVTSDGRGVSDVASDFRNFGTSVYEYPARDLLFSNSDIQWGFEERERMGAVRALLEEKRGIFVTTIDALMDKIPEKYILVQKCLEIYDGMEGDPVNTGRTLADLGYVRVPQVEAVGEYAIRGGIVDIYPMTSENPYRIEFFGEEVDSLRSFDPVSQRSSIQLEKIKIYPAGICGKADGTTSLADYFDKDSLLILDDPNKLKKRGQAVETEFTEYMQQKLERDNNETGPRSMTEIFSFNTVFETILSRRVLLLGGLEDSLRGFGAKKNFVFHSSSVGVYKNSFKLLIADMRKFQEKKYRITLLTPSRLRARRLAENLREYGIRAYLPDENSPELKPGETEVIPGNLSSGYISSDQKYVLMTEADMFGVKVTKKRRRARFSDGEKLFSLEELHPGDYVVHEQHGIGIYRGIEHITRDDIGKDYIKLEYADGGNLYLPATKLELLQKYASGTAHPPKLNSLNGTAWRKTKARVKSAVKDIAAELIALYAARFGAKGVKYSPDTVWQREFEELFPYEETEDQMRAIEAVKTDMESGRVMDRLICGDVGYGKTEIALRAAFKAVQDGKQVAMLVPTTILAEQHYNTFIHRLEKFPVKVGVLSRFQTPEQNKKTVESLKKGGTDVVIGTHRLLSKDVGFKDLGLLVIDEEQRFGVAHKEKIKELKTDVDVLSLTATPIPRTLYMSLSGIRDLSVLSEPPFDRLPVETYVLEYDGMLVKEAVMREVKRGGQIFYVYNRVNTIAEKCDTLRKLMPGIRIEFAHGQMKEGELEEIMYEFVNGHIDVLVSTTIVEAGLDIPNANTLIVDGAERMGLSQLYQLRGRVGRSSRSAYAFLMYRKDRVLNEEAEKRLRAIREFTEFGSGVKIAMRDLEIRGAGNVLGAEQHGQMLAVGYELYCKLLNQAINQLKGIKEEEKEQFETSVECSLDAYIPDDYISDEAQKLDIYKKISLINGKKDYEEVADEIMDRFGDMPAKVQALLDISLLRSEAHGAYITEINVSPGKFVMNIYPRAKINVEVIPELVKEENGRLRFIPGANPRFIYSEGKGTYRSTLKTIEIVREIIKKLKA